MKKLIIILFLFLCIVFESTLLTVWQFLNARPDLLIICVMVGGLTLHKKWAIALSLCAGVLRSLYTPIPWAVFFYPFCIILIMRLSREISLERRFVVEGILLCLIIAKDVVLRLWSYGLFISIPTGIFIRTMLIEAVYTTLVFFLVARPCIHFISDFFKEEQETPFTEWEDDLPPLIET